MTGSLFSLVLGTTRTIDQNINTSKPFEMKTYTEDFVLTNFIWHQVDQSHLASYVHGPIYRQKTAIRKRKKHSKKKPTGTPP
jgi:hypothetical protein